MPEAIACRGVTRTYGAVEALHAVDVEFPAAALSAIVGPSGCGKSTLLRLLAGVDRSDGGVIDVGGTELTSLGPRALRRYRRRGAAYVAQHAAANLIPHLTVAEQLGPQAPVSLLGLEARLRARADELSGGEQARAALVVALSRGTPVVLIDEPTAELDRETAHGVIDALSQVAAAGRTVVVATHDHDLVDVAAARLVLEPQAASEPADNVRLASDEPPVLTLRDVTKLYDGTRAVDGASLEVRGRELAVLLGRSGSGKSTLLMTAGGWLKPDAGLVDIPGPDWAHTSYVAQRFGLLPELSSGDNIALPLRLRGDDLAAVDDVAQRLGLEGLLARPPLETSLGQQQRIALGRALVVGPGLLLADEPTSHQDAYSAERVWGALRAACDAGTACLVATHDERLAARADRVWLIEDGRVRPG